MASWLDRNLKLVIVALAALVVGAVVYIVVQERKGPAPLEVRLDEPTPGGSIEVYITGAVAQPGVYEMDADDRVVDLLYEAGGPASDANLDAIGLARRLHDEDTVVVPRLGQAAGAGPASEVAGAPLNINRATADELMALDGIGEAYSRRIVDSRTADGPFASTDELVERDIIPRTTYERIRELITVGP